MGQSIPCVSDLATPVRNGMLLSMKKIPLSSKKYPGLFAMVDNSDYPRLAKHRWNASVRGTLLRAQRSWKENGHGRTRFMHREILGDIPRGMEVDHHNRNGLDNRRSNLRVVPHAANACNVVRYKHKKSSQFKGVFNRGGSKTNPWRAAIRVNGRLIWLGSFPTEREAALAYNAASLKYHGEYGRRNPV